MSETEKPGFFKRLLGGKAEPVADVRPPVLAIEPEQPKLSWWQKLKSGLARTSSQLTTGISALLTKRKLDAGVLEDLEDLLVQADLGLPTSMQIVATLKRERFNTDITDEEVRAVLDRKSTRLNSSHI